MDKGDVELLLIQAKEFEKQYAWLDAAESYKKASILAVEAKDFQKIANSYENLAYSFYRAALQAKTKKEFENRMVFSAEAYECIIEFHERNDGEEADINHAKAMVAWINSWIESDFARMASLIEEWWTLENKALDVYLEKDNRLAIGKTCNNLMEGSIYNRLFLNAKEFVERSLSGASLGEKAIEVLFKANNNYELTRAYYLTAWHYGIISYYYIIRTKEPTVNLRGKIQEFIRKWRFYSDKALSLAEEIGDSWLIGWAHDTRGLGMNQQMLPDVLQNHLKVVVRHGEITKDNYLLSKGFWGSSMFTVIFAGSEEDPEKRRLKLKEALESSRKALHHSKIIAFHHGILMAQHYYVNCLTILASLGLNLEEKKALLQRAVKIGRESYKYTSQALNQNQIWVDFSLPLATLSQALFLLSKTETSPKEKRRLLEETLKIKEESVSIQSGVGQSIGINSVFSHTSLARTLSELAKISPKSQKKKLLNKAVLSFEKGLENFRRHNELNLNPHMAQALHYGRLHVVFGRILTSFYEVKEDKKLLDRAIDVYRHAAQQFQKAKLSTYLAEIEWSTAKLHDRVGDYFEAAENYENAAKEYQKAAAKVPRLKDFYRDHSSYMQAWSQIELAKYAHSVEDYDKAKKYYEMAGRLHESTDSWSYLSSNYCAWARLEEGESLSRKDYAQKAKEAFQKAIEQFNKAEGTIKQKTAEITSAEEKEMIQRLIEASGLRRSFCQARIQIEEAKLFDREGDYLQSQKSYREAAKKLGSIIEKTGVEAERKELEYLAILCQAWKKMAVAEETTSAESYLDAAKLFEEAKEHCYTRRASIWALGNSNFCKGLAAGARYQTSLELLEHAKAKSFMKSASTNYAKAGFQAASEYARATQRLFDAYLFMNQAEVEADQEKRAKQYQMAENLLQIAAGSFMKAKQPEKTAQVQQILKTVREEKTLALSLNEVMHAPTITSSTISFAAPTATNEASVGLESFEHANVQANLVIHDREVKVGESFCLSIEFVNAGKEPALLTRVEDFIPSSFIVVKKPEIYRLEDSCLNMKGKQIAPLKLVEAKLVLQSSKKGVYQLKPTVHYLDELGHNKSLQLKSLEIIVEEVILADRVSTRTKELDSLLLGGIPKEYAVILTGTPSDERELIIKNFLDAGVGEGQTSFYVSTETAGLVNLLKKPRFYLFLCNPKPKVEVPNLPNVSRLRSKTDLTNLNIALLKAYRNVEQSSNKRICINIVSDVLIDHGAKTTRKWIAELTTDLVSKGFTVLAVINPEMHTPEQTGAVLDLFDGEISITQTGDPLECKKQIQVKKLRGQDYIKNSICLTKF